MKNKIVEKNKIIIPLLMIITSIMFCIPSIIYLIENKTVDGFNSYYTYWLKGYRGECAGTSEGIIVIGILALFSILYFLLIKKCNKIFKNIKSAIIFMIAISFIFTLILPFLSSDIYYYIGDSWLNSKYGENPYYTSVTDLQNDGINDEILRNTGYWANTTSVYGPLWNSIAKMLVGMSNGNITLALYIFKLVSLLIHVLNCYLVYKITNKSMKYSILYGLNPLILVELLCNVHNEIYLIMFVLLAIYFLIEKKSKVFTIIFLAFSVAIKYSTILIVPFILIYMYKEKNIIKKILYCLISGISIIGIVVLLYLPYYRDFTIFTNMLAQGDKYSQSLILFLLEKNKNNVALNLWNKWKILIFAIMYVCILVTELFNKKMTLNQILSKYNVTMLIFIFVILTNFQKWYVLWLIPTIMWQNTNIKKFIIYLTVTAIIPSFGYFVIGTDAWQVGMSYSIQMLILSGILLSIDILISKWVDPKGSDHFWVPVDSVR